MKCSLHPNEDSVGMCSNCGAGLCQHCFNTTEYVIEGKHLCRSCNLQLMNNMLAEEEMNASKSRNKAIFVGICFILGLLAAASTVGKGGGGLVNYFSIAGIGCLPTTWKLTANRLKDDIREGVAEAHGDYSLSFIGIIVRIIFTFLIGGIIAPFVLWFNVSRCRKSKARIAELQNEIEAFQA